MHTELAGANSLKQKAYDAIKEKIIRCLIMPGAPISEKDLMAELEMSRTPIREALNKLETEGLVSIYPKRGIFVTNITLKDVMDIYTIRECIEPLAARLATPLIDLESVQHFVDIYLSPKREHTLEDYIITDCAFHTLIANSTDNPRLAQILLSLYDQNSRIRILSKIRVKERQEKAREEHRELIKCFQARDADRAEEVMRMHITNGKKTALSIL
ncbi:MAG: GntR family transcriptional regulator [Firmicutes bacterium]|jgi:DNA-binding GntR family transcriptional regulator|nr:GntR family transcriptional regulator [Bacillota bacterium]